MRRIRVVLVVVCAALLTACESENKLGKCVGLNGHERADLVYEYSGQNIFWGIVGVEMLYPPIKVALDELKCPVARTPIQAAP